MKKCKSILIVCLVLTLMFTMTVSAGGPASNDKVKSINPSVKWDAEEAAEAEAEIDKIISGGDVSIATFDVTNMSYVRSDTLNASDLPYATASGSYKLYKEDVIDASYDYYVVWMKGTGINQPDTYLFDDSNLHEVRVGTAISRTGDLITDWEPYTDVTMNEDYVNISLGVSHGGVNASISEDVLVHRDHIGPQSIYTYGYYKAHWSGNYEGSQGVVGGPEIRVPKGTGYSYTISLYVDGDQY